MFVHVPILLLTGLLAFPQPPGQRANKEDRTGLQGTWVATSAQGFGKEDVKKLKLTFQTDTIRAHYGDKSAEATYELHATRTPPRST
jgi:hypothetical protein